MKLRMFSVMALVAVMVAALAATAAFAQYAPGRPGPGGFPGGPGPMPFMMHVQPPVVIKATDNNVFMLLGATLIKYDTALKQQGVLDLIKPPTGIDPTPNPNMPPMIAWPTPSTMLVANVSGSESLVILIGDKFFRVDTQSLSIKAQATLPSPEPPKDMPSNPGGMNQPMPPMLMGPPPPSSIELQGDKLYVLRANILCGINIKDGSITGQTTLPEPPKPTEIY